jgi:hypothetical protein
MDGERDQRHPEHVKDDEQDDEPAAVPGPRRQGGHAQHQQRRERDIAEAVDRALP